MKPGSTKNKTEKRLEGKPIPFALIPVEIARSWFCLTPGEQRALLIVITILLAGMLVMAWHGKTTHDKGIVAATDRTQTVDE